MKVCDSDRLGDCVKLSEGLCEPEKVSVSERLSDPEKVIVWLTDSVGDLVSDWVSDCDCDMLCEPEKVRLSDGLCVTEVVSETEKERVDVMHWLFDGVADQVYEPGAEPVIVCEVDFVKVCDSDRLGDCVKLSEGLCEPEKVSD